MAFLIYVFCTVFIQLTYGQTSFLSGQRAINAQTPSLTNALSNAWPLTQNAQSSRSLGAVPATNSLASQMAITANGLANTNLAGVNTINTSGNIPRVNPSLNNVNTNTPSQSLASSLASANAATVSNFANIANSNPGANKIQTFNIANPGKIASSVSSSKYPFSPFAQSYGNYANQNFASAKPAMATWPNAATGNYYSQSMLNGPGNQQYGINIQADGLEIAGSVTVTGKMPIYGTVSLNGRVPTEGTGTVNYAC